MPKARRKPTRYEFVDGRYRVVKPAGRVREKLPPGKRKGRRCPECRRWVMTLTVFTDRIERRWYPHNRATEGRPGTGERCPMSNQPVRPAP